MVEVRVIARAEAREGKANELKALLRGLINPARASQGCKYYELFASDLPGVFYFNELWESQAALNVHVASSVFKEISGKASELLREPLEVNLLKAVE